MKYQVYVLLVAAVVAFSAGAQIEVDPVVVWEGPCDWKKTNTPLPGCTGTDSHCNQGCNTACSGLNKKEYLSPGGVQSGGDMQKTTTPVNVQCIRNKNCGHTAVPNRECDQSNGTDKSCDHVDITIPSCSWCDVQSENTTTVLGYALRACPTGSTGGGGGGVPGTETVPGGM